MTNGLITRKSQNKMGLSRGKRSAYNPFTGKKLTKEQLDEAA